MQKSAARIPAGVLRRDCHARIRRIAGAIRSSGLETTAVTGSPEVRVSVVRETSHPELPLPGGSEHNKGRHCMPTGITTPTTSGTSKFVREWYMNELVLKLKTFVLATRFEYTAESRKT